MLKLEDLMTIVKDVFSNIRKYRKQSFKNKITFYSANERALSGYIPFEYSGKLDVILTDIFIPKPKEEDPVVCVVPYQSIFDYNTRKTYFIFNDSFNTVCCVEDPQEAIVFDRDIKNWYAKNILFKWHKGLFEASLREFQFNPLFSLNKQMLSYTKEELQYIYKISI